MASKHLIFAALLVAAIATPMAEGQLGIIKNLLGLIHIGGTVMCSANGNSISGTSTPAFSNATVQLRCGGNVVSTAVTNGSGVFSILLDPLSYLLSAILSNCNAVVTTPLSNCNSSLSPTGILSAPLQLLSSTVSGLLPVTNIITGLFQFLPID